MRITVMREVKVPASASMNEKLMLVNVWLKTWQETEKAAIQAVRPIDESTFTVEMEVDVSEVVSSDGP